MNAAVAESVTPNFTAIKAKQQTTWGSGNYSKIGITLQITGENLCEAMDMRAGQNVLDVAAGNGNATIAAARRFLQVTSTDYVEELLNDSKRRAEACGFDIEYKQADAENLPFAANCFDNVVSTFGVMFAPDQETVASELRRVCKSGGKIGMANWTPNGFIGQIFKTLGQYITPPPGLQSPARWGNEEFIFSQFSTRGDKVILATRDYVFRYKSPTHFLDTFISFYGPILKAFENLDTESGTALRGEILALIERFNKATDGTMVVPSEYLEIVITRS